MTGLMNATKDVVALNESWPGSTQAQPAGQNELPAGTPLRGGLDLLVAHTGVFAVGDFAGTWNVPPPISAHSYAERGGTRHRRTHLSRVRPEFGEGHRGHGDAQRQWHGDAGAEYGIYRGQCGVCDDGAGCHDEHDERCGDRGEREHRAAGVLGTVPAELTVLVKTSGVYAKSDVVGVAWTMDSALGRGRLPLPRAARWRERCWGWMA